MSTIRKMLPLIFALILAGCSYTGGQNPVARSVGWFGYINGEDIRKVCGHLGADRYRFVYNGIYQWQTRSYDVFFHSKKIVMKVRGRSELNKIETDDLFAPWRGTTAELLVNNKTLENVKKTLKASAALQPSPTGLRLYSDQFYWTVAACVDGKFNFNAYKWPSQRWDNMVFDDLLLALDVTDIEPEKPRSLSPLDIWGGMDKVDPFLIQLGENGLVGFSGG